MSGPRLYITRDGSYVDMRGMDIGRVRKLRSKLTLTHTNIMGNILQTKCFHNAEDEKGSPLLQVPRFASDITGIETRHSSLTPRNRIRMAKVEPRSLISFRGNQTVIYDEIMDKYFSPANIVNGNSGLILKLGAGEGKTFIAMKIIEELCSRTLIITHNKGILAQWSKLLGQYLPDFNVGFLYGKCKRDGDIIIAVINSLCKPRYHFDNGKSINRADLFRGIDLCILDECHEYCGKTRREVLWEMNVPYVMGLSATPDKRPDKLHVLNSWLVGPVLDAASIPGYEHNTFSFSARVRMIKYRGNYRHTSTVYNESTNLPSSQGTLNRILGDGERISMIVEEIRELLKLDRFIFVFADRRTYLVEIFERLVNEGIDGMILDDDSASVLLGGSTTEQIQKAEEMSRVILTTYAFMGTGKSIPKMDAIILATPRKTKSEQFVNRIFRLDGDTSIERIIVDIVDWDSLFKNQWYRRKKYYRNKGYDIMEVLRDNR